MRISSQILILSIFLMACGQDHNSNSGDRPVQVEDLADGLCTSESGARFCAALAVYELNCFACHSNWAQFNTEQAWVNAGLVVPGDTARSPAISRLINAGSNMPLGGSALPNSEYQALLDWVQQMTVE